MIDDVTGNELLQPDGESLGDVLSGIRQKGLVQGLDVALAIVADVRKEYERQFGGHFLSSNEARRIFRLAMDAAEKALKAARRSGPAAGRGPMSLGR